MAEKGEIQSHEATYNGFMKLLHWGMAVVAIVTLGVVLLIAS